MLLHIEVAMANEQHGDHRDEDMLKPKTQNMLFTEDGSLELEPSPFDDFTDADINEVAALLPEFSQEDEQRVQHLANEKFQPDLAHAAGHFPQQSSSSIAQDSSQASGTTAMTSHQATSAAAPWNFRWQAYPSGIATPSAGQTRAPWSQNHYYASRSTPSSESSSVSMELTAASVSQPATSTLPAFLHFLSSGAPVNSPFPTTTATHFPVPAQPAEWPPPPAFRPSSTSYPPRTAASTVPTVDPMSALNLDQLQTVLHQLKRNKRVLETQIRDFLQLHPLLIKCLTPDQRQAILPQQPPSTEVFYGQRAAKRAQYSRMNVPATTAF
eukprot:TRINITY_DN6731_c0_g1_i1.p1 TRINITY_DN6731_c0_g1~~TRINITY_DN6731_c0_g1_i1.p1  ORF type:complete len:326 (+),score=49.66 TRINITY_DN6731_c0_g1_i1:193-1170(+)